MQGIEGKRGLWTVSLKFAVALGAFALNGGVMAWTGKPLAYCIQGGIVGPSKIEVIDTGDNKLVAQIPGQPYAEGLAITPDGKRLYIANSSNSYPDSDGSVSVIDTASEKVVATVAGIPGASAVAVAPDGGHVYVTGLSFLYVLDVATNAIAATIPFPNDDLLTAVAVTPDGKYIYVADQNRYNMVVIDTATNAIIATIQFPYNFNVSTIAMAPDGRHAYATVDGFRTKYGSFDYVYVIDTNSNQILAEIFIGDYSAGSIAVTPDGKRAYVVNRDAIVEIDTLSNMVVATLPYKSEYLALTSDGKYLYSGADGSTNFSSDVFDTVGNALVSTIPTTCRAIVISALPAAVPFSNFTADLKILQRPGDKRLLFHSSFTLGSGGNGIDPPTEPVILQINGFSTTIPAGSFRGKGFGPFKYNGVIDGVRLEAAIIPTGAKRYEMDLAARRAKPDSETNPAQVTLRVGDDRGSIPVKADFETLQQFANSLHSP